MPGKWILLAMLVAASAGAADGTVEDLPQWDFVVGRYQMIGRQPDHGLTYHGTARIERVGQRLRLTRTVGGQTRQILGVVRRADPGEAWVLAFAWREKKPMEMVCLIGSDLDNYARLTCHWGVLNNPHRQPGMEAYFAREPWEPLR